MTLFFGVQTNWSLIETCIHVWTVALCVLCVCLAMKTTVRRSLQQHQLTRMPRRINEKQRCHLTLKIKPRIADWFHFSSFSFFSIFFPNGNGRVRVPFCRGLAKRCHYLHGLLVGRSASIESPEKAAVTRIVKRYGHCVNASLHVYRL